MRTVQKSTHIVYALDVTAFVFAVVPTGFGQDTFLSLTFLSDGIRGAEVHQRQALTFGIL